MLGLHSGDRYPCTIKGTNNDSHFKEKSNEELICVFEEGIYNANRLIPMRIYMTNFEYASQEDISIIFLYNNSVSEDIIPVFDMKLFGGSATNKIFNGENMYGYATLFDSTFKTTS